jgi:hypothetical protein
MINSIAAATRIELDFNRERELKDAPVDQPRSEQSL